MYDINTIQISIYMQTDSQWCSIESLNAPQAVFHVFFFVLCYPNSVLLLVRVN